MQDPSLCLDAWTALDISFGLAMFALAARYVLPKARPFAVGFALQAAGLLIFSATIAVTAMFKSEPIAIVGVVAGIALLITASLALIKAGFEMMFRAK